LSPFKGETDDEPCVLMTCVLLCDSTSSSDLVVTMGSLYGSVLFICFNNAGTVQAMVSIERTVHYREKAAGMYSAIPYALAQVMPILSHFGTSCRESNS